MSYRKALKALLRSMKKWLDEDEELSQPENSAVAFDNRDEWLRYGLRKFIDPLCFKKPQYVWGVLKGAALAKVLGLKQISVIEFGVAGGAGLLALEHVANKCEKEIDIKIEVYGFDTGAGLPKPQDYRDSPHIWSEGYYPTDMGELAKRLRRAVLKVGFVNQTVPDFIQSSPAPVAFVAFDLDLYSSTRAALCLLDAGHSLLLPRVACYFDDVIGDATFCEYIGERLAISEFNAGHSERKLAPMHALEYFVPPEFNRLWPKKFYYLHVFDHPLYTAPDSLRKPMFIDIEGRESFGNAVKGIV